MSVSSVGGLNHSDIAALRHLETNRKREDKSLSRLASGHRITVAADDAAGLAISENMRADIRSLNQARRNAGDAVNMVQVSEGALAEITNMVIRIRELSIQGASDTMGDTERGMMDREVQALKDEIDRISEITEFNGYKLLNGSQNELDFQIGIQDSENDRIVFKTEELANNTHALAIFDVDTLTKESSRDNLFKLDFALQSVNESRASLGALQNRLEVTARNLAQYSENLSSAKSRIKDLDFAMESSEQVAAQILTHAGISVLAQVHTQSKNILKLIE